MMKNYKKEMCVIFNSFTSTNKIIHHRRKKEAKQMIAIGNIKLLKSLKNYFSF